MARAPETTEVETVTRGARRREETRRRLLAAARRVFAREGLETATIGQITAEADAGFGTFYLHFTTKEEAYRAVITEGFDELEMALERVREETRVAPWSALIHAAVRAYIKFASDNRELFAVMCEGGGVGEGLGQELTEHFATALATQIAASATETGATARPWPYPPMPVAIATVSALTRAVLWWLGHEAPDDTPSNRDESLETLIATMSRYVTAALWGQIPPEPSI